MQYHTFDFILEGWEAETENDAIEFAQAFDFSETESHHQNIGYARHVDTVNGIEVYYDYGADYYFFCPSPCPPKAVWLAALYAFTAHCHSGQWSRGYRLLCRTGRAWTRHTGLPPRLDYWEALINNEPQSPVTVLYNELVAAHGGTV